MIIISKHKVTFFFAKQKKREREKVLNFEKERGSITSIDLTKLELEDWDFSAKLLNILKVEHYLKLLLLLLMGCTMR